MNKLQIRLARLVERLAEDQKMAVQSLLAAIDRTEASRKALHEAGKECWVDQLDHEE